MHFPAPRTIRANRSQPTAGIPAACAGTPFPAAATVVKVVLVASHVVMFSNAWVDRAAAQARGTDVTTTACSAQLPRDASACRYARTVARSKVR